MGGFTMGTVTKYTVQYSSFGTFALLYCIQFRLSRVFRGRRVSSAPLERFEDTGGCLTSTRQNCLV
jgi:hypothetical protein